MLLVSLTLLMLTICPSILVKNSWYCSFTSVMVLRHCSRLLGGSDVSVFFRFAFLFDSMLNSYELSFILKSQDPVKNTVMECWYES